MKKQAIDYIRKALESKKTLRNLDDLYKKKERSINNTYMPIKRLIKGRKLKKSTKRCLLKKVKSQRKRRETLKYDGLTINDSFRRGLANPPKHMRNIKVPRAYQRELDLRSLVFIRDAINYRPSKTQRRNLLSIPRRQLTGKQLYELSKLCTQHLAANFKIGRR